MPKAKTQEGAATLNLDKATVEQLATEYERQLRAAFKEALEKVPQETHALLQKAKYEIINNALGFRTDSWNGRWEVDHCNGRQTAVANELGAVVMREIKAALPEFVEQVASQPPKKMLDALKQEYLDVYGREMRTAIRALAAEDAKRDAAKAVEGLKQLTRVTAVQKGRADDVVGSVYDY